MSYTIKVLIIAQWPVTVYHISSQAVWKIKPQKKPDALLAIMLVIHNTRELSGKWSRTNCCLETKDLHNVHSGTLCMAASCPARLITAKLLKRCVGELNALV